jgi:hypothetical protein
MGGEHLGGSWRSRLEGWEVNETGPRLCPVAVFGIMSVEPLGFVNQWQYTLSDFFL